MRLDLPVKASRVSERPKVAYQDAKELFRRHFFGSLN